jgi:hypothetical protein
MSVSDADIDEFKNLSRNAVPKSVGAIATGLYFSCILLDVAYLIGTVMYPHVFARYACAIRPFGAIAWPLFSEDLLRFSADQCLGAIEEPSTSIILLSFKFSLGILLLLIVCSFVAFRPQGLLTLIEACFLRKKTSEAYYRELRCWGQRLVVIGAIDIAGILLSSRDSVADFNTSIIHKLSLEDGFAIVLIPSSVFYALIFLVDVSLNRVEHRISPSKDDKRSP